MTERLLKKYFARVSATARRASGDSTSPRIALSRDSGNSSMIRNCVSIFPKAEYVGAAFGCHKGTIGRAYVSHSGAQVECGLKNDVKKICPAAGACVLFFLLVEGLCSAVPVAYELWAPEEYRTLSEPSVQYDQHVGCVAETFSQRFDREVAKVRVSARVRAGGRGFSK